MIWIVYYMGLSAVSLFVLWAMFVIVFTMKQLRESSRLAPGMVKFGEAIALVGYVHDVLCQIFIATVVFIEPPTEFTISARLRRLVKGDRSKWRTRLAIWFASVLMNPFCPPDDPHIPIPSDIAA